MPNGPGAGGSTAGGSGPLPQPSPTGGNGPTSGGSSSGLPAGVNAFMGVTLLCSRSTIQGVPPGPYVCTIYVFGHPVGSFSSGTLWPMVAIAAGSLAPMANGAAQAGSAATQMPKATPPQPLTEVPGTAPEIQMEDLTMKNIFRLMTSWLRGGGLGPLPPSTVAVPIISPCAIVPSMQSLPSCGGTLAGGGVY
jgi:hypothetical protein